MKKLILKTVVIIFCLFNTQLNATTIYGVMQNGNPIVSINFNLLNCSACNPPEATGECTKTQTDKGGSSGPAWITAILSILVFLRGLI